MAGYDISASYSRSQTLGSRAGEGDFVIYGSNTLPPWIWAVMIGGALLLAWKFFFSKK